MLKNVCTMFMVLLFMMTGTALADVEDVVQTEATADDQQVTLTDISFDDQQSQTMSNYMNGSLFAIEDGCLIGLCWDADGNAMLARRNLTGDDSIVGDNQALDTGCIASYINIFNGKAYYVRTDNSGDESGIYVVDISGGEPKQVLNGEYGSLQLYGGSMYYTDADKKLFACDMDGGNPKQVGDISVCFPYVVNDEWLIYQDVLNDEKLCAYRFTDGYILTLSENRSYLPIIKETWLYYFEKSYAVDDPKADRANICRLDLMTLNVERAVGFSGVYLALNGEYMFAANGYKLQNEEAWWTIENDAYENIEKAPVYANDEYLISLIYEDGTVARVEVERIADRAAVSYNS